VCKRVSDKPIIKVIDFGTSTMINPGKSLKTKIGTAYYIAPEVINKDYNEKCDIWSIGVILYVLLCGYPPFRGSSDEEIIQKVQIGEFTFTPNDWKFVSEEAKDLVKRMLTKDHNFRPSAD
jgi:calcium-dependent protein kinase